MTKERLFYLDLIRALSFIFVVLFHYNIHLDIHSINTGKIFNFITNDFFGAVGVSLFIIISGSALMYSYQDKFHLRTFYKKRFWSIYPVFWTGYIFAFIFTFYTDKTINEAAPNWTIILSILGLDGYTTKLVTNFYLVGEWFLGFILLFYIIFPVLRKFVIAWPKTLICISLILFIVSVQLDFKAYIGYSDLFSRMPEFIFGMLFIYYIKKGNHKFIFIIAIIALVSILISDLYIYHQYVTTIAGISSFIIIAFIAEMIKNGKIKTIITFLSKYSFAGIITNQLVMVYIMKTFNGLSLSIYESYLLFFIVFLVIIITAMGIVKVANMVTQFIRASN